MLRNNLYQRKESLAIVKGVRGFFHFLKSQATPA